MKINIEMLPIDQVNPSAYNPRSADQYRLSILELSLRKLGFIHPLFSDSDGELLSGHQRHLCAKRIGLKKVPVIRVVGRLTLDERKAINIAFNRGTNDLQSYDTVTTMKAFLATHDPHVIAADLPDCPPDRMYRCASPDYVDLDLLIQANKGRFDNQYARNIASVLWQRHIYMPIVCTPDNHVVNGIGRLVLYAEKKIQQIPVVYISDDEAEFSNVMLNYLSMDFDIHRRYADLLRYNSFRRPTGVKKTLGRSFTFAIVRSKSSASFDMNNPKNLALWMKTYGQTVCDFGCGLMDETNILRSHGIDSVPFEPFFLDEKRNICPPKAREIARDFLKRVADGTQFDSIFLSAVLNSVPFLEDRKHIIAILNALCCPATKVFAHAASDKMSHYTNVVGKHGLKLDKSSMSLSKFLLDYEPRTTIGDYDNPKVQKYHTPQEWYGLWSEFFDVVKVSESQNNVECICERAKPITMERLKVALRHEFNLPYPDGSRMGLDDEAIDSFVARQAISGRKFS